MTNYKDICKVDRILPIHQLNKLNEKGTKRQDFFPISVVQAIFDKTGIRLDAIISSFNYIFLPWKGTKEDTRLQVVGLMRRKSLVVCYRDLDDNITIEMYISNNRGDDEWKKNDNWKDFADWIKETLEDIFKNLEDYPDIWETIKELISAAIDNSIKQLVNEWLNTNGEQIINDYFSQLDLSNQVSQLVNQYLQGDEFSQLLNNIVNSYLEGLNIDDTISNIVNGYLQDYDFSSAINNYLQEYLAGDTFKNLIQNAINKYLEDNDITTLIDNSVKTYLDAKDFSTEIGDAVSNYFNSEEFTQKIKDIVNNYMNENGPGLVDDAMEEVKQYIMDNERVTANALARHEQAITILQNPT